MPLSTLEIIYHEINERASVDINPLKGLEDPRLFDEFNQLFVGKITMDHTIQKPRNC